MTHAGPETPRQGGGAVFVLSALGVLTGIAGAVGLMVAPPEWVEALSPGVRGLLIVAAFALVPAPFIALGLWLRGSRRR